MNEWLDREEYPFQSRYFELPMGRMHYIDEGQSEHAIVMVHGNPAWSFVFREQIKCLSRHFRCVAMDHIGFGLSDKPRDWDYLPASHARNLAQLLAHLEIESATLMVGDWGGPIGLAYALDQPHRIRSLIITNSWMWSLKGIAHYEMFSGLMGSAIGRYLIRRHHFFVRVLMKSMFRLSLSERIHRHYVEPLRIPEQRKGCWTFPREIIGSSEWLDSLWSRREVLADMPALLLWGMRDIAFRDIELRRWQGIFTQPEVHEFADTGHFVQEQQGRALCPLIEQHIRRVLT